MPAPTHKPKVAILLLRGASEGSGGTGRRFARLFAHFQQRQEAGERESRVEPWLVVREDMLDLMSRSSIRIDPSRNVRLFPAEPEPARGPIGRLREYQRYSEALRGLLDAEGFDVVHLLLPSLPLVPYLLRRDPRRHRIFSMTATRGSFDLLPWQARLLYRLNFEACDAIDTLYAITEESFGIRGGKTRVSPCSFTNPDRFQPAETKRNVLVFAGRLEEDKNPTLFVDAVAQAAATLRAQQWKCLLLGAGPLQGALAQRVAEHGLGDLVELGARPDLAPVFAESRVFVSLQKTENYPSQSLLEAMAADNAVIATDVGETRRLVDTGNGLLIAEQTPAVLAAAIEQLCEDPVLCETLGRASRERIVSEHSIDRYADYMEALWLEVAGLPRPPRGLSPASLVRIRP